MLNKILFKIYNIIFIIFLPLLFARLFIKSLKYYPYRLRWGERLGFFFKPNLTNNIWLHAVSVGEIMASTSIINILQNKLPRYNIIITCTTPGGSYIVTKLFKDNPKIAHYYLPFDISWAINNFINKIEPKLLIILEKELWPNLIINCNNKNIPIIIANAQMSNKSFKRYWLIRPLIAYLLKKINFIGTQTKFDSYKFKKFLNIKNIKNIGNTKFDVALQAIKENLAPKINQPIWIAASTHFGEEQLIIDAHKKVLASIPDAILILVPRHIERCKNIINNIDNNLKIIIRSQQNLVHKIPDGQIYLADTMGELNLLYSMSQVALVAGSLVPHIGGHNVLEPASLGLPIIVGPYTANCRDIVFKLERYKGLFIINNSDQLAVKVIELLQNHDLRAQIGLNAKKFLYQQAGASDYVVKEALGILDSMI